MATHTYLSKGDTAKHSVGNNSSLRRIQHQVDFSDLVSYVSEEQIKVFDIPADSALLFLDVEILTAITSDGSTETLEVGDSSNDDVLVAGETTVTAGTVATQAVTTMPLARYSTADAIYCSVASTDITNLAGKIQVTAVLCDCSANLPAEATVTVDNS